jgi:hypothetical protein
MYPNPYIWFWFGYNLVWQNNRPCTPLPKGQRWKKNQWLSANTLLYKTFQHLHCVWYARNTWERDYEERKCKERVYFSCLEQARVKEERLNFVDPIYFSFLFTHAKKVAENCLIPKLSFLILLCTT